VKSPNLRVTKFAGRLLKVDVGETLGPLVASRRDVIPASPKHGEVVKGILA